MLNRLRMRQGTEAEWTSADPVLAAGEPGYVTDTGEFVLGDGTTLFSALDRFTAGSGSGASIASDGGAVNTSESTSSTSYTDLATVGPAATVTVGASGIVIVHFIAQMANDTADGFTAASFATSGDASEAANEDWALVHRGGSTATLLRASGMRRISGLTAGHSLTFTMKYRVGSISNTGTFHRRHIVAITY